MMGVVFGSREGGNKTSISGMDYFFLLSFLKKTVLAPWLLGNPPPDTRMGNSLLQIATQPFRLPEPSLKMRVAPRPGLAAVWVPDLGGTRR